MGPREIGRLRQKCFSFGKTLLACRREFCFSLKVGDFEMSLGTGGTGDRRARPSTKMQWETKPCVFPEAKAAPGGFSGEERLGWRQFGWAGFGCWGRDGG